MKELIVNPTEYIITDNAQTEVQVSFNCNVVLSDVKLSIDGGVTYQNKLSMTQNNATFSIDTTENKVLNCKLKGYYDEVSTVPVESVSLDRKSYEFSEFGMVNINATVSPSNATDKSVVWTSSNPSVATVNNGLVSALSNGTTVITCSSVEGNKSDTCNVTVNVVAVGETNYFDISKGGQDNNCTHSVSGNNISVTSVNNGNWDGYSIWGIDKMYEGRRYKLTTTSDNDKCFARVRINGTKVGESSMKKVHEFEFDGKDAKDNIIVVDLGIRGRGNTSTTPMTTVFTDVKIVDVNGKYEPPIVEGGLTYSVENYKIVITDGTTTESYGACAEVPVGANVQGHKKVISNGKEYYLPLSNVGTSAFVIDGLKPIEHGYLDSAFKATWSNRGYAVANNTLKYTVKNSPTNPVNQGALEKALEIVNSAIPGKFVITLDNNSVNEVRETSFVGSEKNVLGICRLHNGEKFIADMNTNMFGTNSSSDAFVGILVHELCHSTGIWDYNPDTPSIYNQNRDIGKTVYLQPSDIRYIKDRFAHLL